MAKQPQITGTSELTLTAAKKDPRLHNVQGSLTSAGGTLFFTMDPTENLSLGVYKNGAPLSVALTNDIRADGDMSLMNYKEDPDHDPTSVLDYLKADTRGMTGGKITRLADTVNVVAQLRILGLKGEI